MNHVMKNRGNDPLQFKFTFGVPKGNIPDTVYLHRGPKNSLQVQSNRILRLSDPQKSAMEFQPSLGTIPPSSVAEYAGAFSKAVVDEIGVFFPLYRMCFLVY